MSVDRIIPWPAVLTGKIVESSEASDKFLWDFNNTLEERVAEYHYDELTSILKKRGMGRYTDSHESGRAFIADGMGVNRSADIPMRATWTSTGSTLPTKTIGGQRYPSGFRGKSQRSGILWMVPSHRFLIPSATAALK